MIRIDGKDRGAGGVDLYLKQISGVDLLSHAEECALAAAIARGDADARSRMIRANLRLVVRIARDYAGRGLSMDDLIGEGNLGLIRAAEEFDPGFGTRFSTYASHWIKQAIRHALTNTSGTIRLPAHMVTILAKWRKAERALGRELGRAPTDDEVAVTLGLTDAQLALVDRARRASALRPGGGEDDRDWAADSAGDHRDSPDASLEEADECRQLRDRLDRLEPRERTILALRFGLEGQEPMTLKQVGARLGVTREWVRKIELRAVRKLDGPGLAASAPATPAAPRKRKRRVVTPARPAPAPILVGPMG